jgi:hypothetical protein
MGYMYQLWKLSPSTCIDVAMYHAFYELSAIRRSTGLLHGLDSQD